MESNQKIEMEREQQRREETKKMEQEPPQNISPMQPLTESAYGGGMYGTDDDGQQQSLQKKPASDTQSADGPVEAGMKPKHAPPPSSGDRDIDITGQSYFQ